MSSLWSRTCIAQPTITQGKAAEIRSSTAAKIKVCVPPHQRDDQTRLIFLHAISVVAPSLVTVPPQPGPHCSIKEMINPVDLKRWINPVQSTCMSSLWSGTCVPPPEAPVHPTRSGSTSASLRDQRDGVQADLDGVASSL